MSSLPWHRAAIASLLLLLLPCRAVAYPPYHVVHGWPILPPGRILGMTAGVAVNAKGEVFVFDRGFRAWKEPLPVDLIPTPTIEVFDGRSGRLLREWGANQFAMPHGISIDRSGNIWLTDVALNQVFKFSPAGKLLLTLGERGVAGADGTHFDRPTDVAVLSDGTFLVSDGYRNTRVAKFSADGRFLKQWGTPGKAPGQFDTPHALAIDRSGRVYVADRENDRVQVFDGEGGFLAQWRSARIGRPYGLATLPGDRMAIVDGGEQPKSGPDRSGLVIVDRQGNVEQRIGRFGNYDGQFWVAHDVAADDAGTIYVVDIAGQRVQKFIRR